MAAEHVGGPQLILQSLHSAASHRQEERAMLPSDWSSQLGHDADVTSQCALTGADVRPGETNFMPKAKFKCVTNSWADGIFSARGEKNKKAEQSLLTSA